MIKPRSGTEPTYFMTMFLCIVMVFLLGSIARAQDSMSQKDGQVATNTPGKTSDVKLSNRKVQPKYRDYKKVQIGMKQEEAREILGKPKSKSDRQDLFVFSDNEMAQVFYNAEGSVYAISATYMGDLASAPTAMSVIGEDPPVQEDGAIYKMIRYPESGYWVSYNQTGGENRTVTITLQKM